MTRSYNFRSARRVARPVRPSRDPCIARLSFRCYRLVPIGPSFESVELCFPPSAMAVLATRM